MTIKNTPSPAPMSQSGSITVSRPIEWMLFLLLIVAYVVSGKLGMSLALEPGYASPIFPPAGIAIAAVFLLGGRALPWVFVGSLLLNGWIDYSSHHEFGRVGVIAAVVIAFASMLQAAVGGLTLRRAINISADTTSGNIQHILRFLLLAPLICLVSASISVSGLWLLGIIDAANFSINWGSWWLGDTFGVIVMFPLVLSAFIGPKALWPSRVLTITAPALLVLSSGLVAVYFMQNAAMHSAHRIQLDDFGAQSRIITLRIEQRLEAYEQVLRGVRGLYIASPHVKRDEFHDYVSTLDLAKYYPGIQGVGFSTWVTPQKKADLIGAIHEEGFPQFKIYPLGERAEYSAIIYLEPFSGRNLKAFGYDMYSESVRRAAMQQSRDQNRVVMSGKVRLVQEDGRDEQAGFLMYLPVYREGSPHATAQERRANIVGWVYAVFRMNDLMQGILGEQGDNFDLEIYDGEGVRSKNQMYDTFATHNPDITPLFSVTRQIETAGHVWTIKLDSMPLYEQKIDTSRVSIIRISGLVMSLLLALMVWLLASGRSRALKLAQLMTSELRKSRRQLIEAQRLAKTGSWSLDIESNTFSWSDEISRIFEIAPVADFDLSYDAFLNVIHPEDRARVDETFKESIESHKPYNIEHRLLLPDGRIKFVHENVETLYDEDGPALSLIGTVQDITEQKQAQDQVEWLAHYDMLTNLPNRALFFDRLRQGLAQAKRNKWSLALLYMDLDGFKSVNDTLGHHVGDLLLVAVAERLTQCVRETDTVSRLGGDEFTVILNGMQKTEDAIVVAQKIIKAISLPFNLEGHEVHIGISIGVAHCTEKTSKEDALVKIADRAMYEAKLAGKNTYRVGFIPAVID